MPKSLAPLWLKIVSSKSGRAILLLGGSTKKTARNVSRVSVRLAKSAQQGKKTSIYIASLTVSADGTYVKLTWDRKCTLSTAEKNAIEATLKRELADTAAELAVSGKNLKDMVSAAKDKVKERRSN